MKKNIRLTFQSSPVIMTNNATFVAGEQFTFFSSISHSLFHISWLYMITRSAIFHAYETKTKKSGKRKAERKPSQTRQRYRKSAPLSITFWPSRDGRVMA